MGIAILAGALALTIDRSGAMIAPLYTLLEYRAWFRVLYGSRWPSVSAVSVALAFRVATRPLVAAPDGLVTFVAFGAGMCITALLMAMMGRVLRQLESSQSERAALVSQLVRVGEDERKRLAAALHDGPIQRITAMDLKLSRVALMLDRGITERAAQILGESQHGLRDVIADLRLTMSSLRPPVLDERGLAEALRDHMLAMTRGLALDGRVECNMPFRVNADMETALYRIVQEALVNVVKHAGAQRVDVSLTERDGDVVLEIRDDGVGFAVDTERGGDAGWQHFGLATIRERAKAMGGVVSVQSAPGEGTAVQVNMPLSGHTAAVQPDTSARDHPSVPPPKDGRDDGAGLPVTLFRRLRGTAVSSTGSMPHNDNNNEHNVEVAS